MRPPFPPADPRDGQGTVRLMLARGGRCGLSSRWFATYDTALHPEVNLHHLPAIRVGPAQRRTGWRRSGEWVTLSVLL